jgi:hypothetical protein
VLQDLHQQGMNTAGSYVSIAVLQDLHQQGMNTAGSYV